MGLFQKFVNPSTVLFLPFTASMLSLALECFLMHRLNEGFVCLFEYLILKTKQKKYLFERYFTKQKESTFKQLTFHVACYVISF